jgi:hypothetical protein
MRFVFDESVNDGLMAIMSITFLAGLPFLVGYLTIWLWKDERTKTSKLFQFFYPMIPIFGFFLITLLLAIEGWACWLMMLPVFLIIAGLGGLLAGYLKNRSRDKLYISLVMLLPFIIGPIEQVIDRPETAYKVTTTIDINSTAEAIWKNVTRVREISDKEDNGKLSDFLGFPRPIKAELDFEGNGAHRKAIFDKGLEFDEDVIEYEHLKKMRFTISANPYDIPSTTMDEHIVIGGDYFDVLTGEYRLVKLSDQNYRLELDSEFILNTSFNFYASFWAKHIMKDIQVNIINVIKERAENE